MRTSYKHQIERKVGLELEMSRLIVCILILAKYLKSRLMEHVKVLINLQLLPGVIGLYHLIDTF